MILRNNEECVINSTETLFTANIAWELITPGNLVRFLPMLGGALFYTGLDVETVLALSITLTALAGCLLFIYC